MQLLPLWPRWVVRLQEYQRCQGAGVALAAAHAGAARALRLLADAVVVRASAARTLLCKKSEVVALLDSFITELRGTGHSFSMPTQVDLLVQRYPADTSRNATVLPLPS